MRPRPLVTTAAVFLVFFLGAFSGWVGKGRFDVATRKFEPPLTFPQVGPGPFQQIVDGELDLNPEQKMKIDQILLDAQHEAQEIRQTINQKYGNLSCSPSAG